MQSIRTPCKSLPTNSSHVRLTAAYLEFLHDEGIAIGWPEQDEVQAFTCLDLNLLESAPVNPFQTYEGRDLNPTVLDKAACMFLHITGGHIFQNGNKRTGVLALDQFLLLNGVWLFLPEKKMTRLAERTADRKTLNISDEQMLMEIHRALAKNSVPIRVFRAEDMAFYRRLLKVRKMIREHPQMQPGARPVQVTRQRPYS